MDHDNKVSYSKLDRQLKEINSTLGEVTIVVKARGFLVQNAPTTVPLSICDSTFIRKMWRVSFGVCNDSGTVDGYWMHSWLAQGLSTAPWFYARTFVGMLDSSFECVDDMTLLTTKMICRDVNSQCFPYVSGGDFGVECLCFGKYHSLEKTARLLSWANSQMKYSACAACSALVEYAVRITRILHREYYYIRRIHR